MGVATAVAIGGLVVSGAATAMSFSQAQQQKNKQRQAEADAAAAMAEARKKLGVNFAEKRSIQKEPYELAREAALSSGAQLIEAGRESDRGPEATAGKVQMAQNLGQAEIRGAMGQELTDIEKDIINEDSRLRDIGVQLDLGEAEGAQLAARDAEEAATQATMEGFQSAASTLEQGLAMIPLFQKTSSARKFDRMENKASKKGLTQQQFKEKAEALSTDPRFSSLAGVGGKSNEEFQSIMTEFTPSQLRAIRKKLGLR
jgi:hypothetical protein